MRKPSLEELWSTVPDSEGRAFDQSDLEGLPESAKRYLSHAIAPGTPLATAVRLKMHGEIKLKSWLPFKAEQVIRLDRGLLWQATVKMMGLPMTGYDMMIDGFGEMRWKYVGIIPVVHASGPDILKSANGRMRAECCWLPSAFLLGNPKWRSATEEDVSVEFDLLHVREVLSFGLGPEGIKEIKMRRWGSPASGEFQLMDFGGVIEEERTFGGYTIPTKLRIGWHYGSERFEQDGEFIRVQVDSAEFK